MGLRHITLVQTRRSRHRGASELSFAKKRALIRSLVEKATEPEPQEQRTHTRAASEASAWQEVEYTGPLAEIIPFPSQE